MAQRIVFEVEVVCDSVDGVSARPEVSPEVRVGNVHFFQCRLVNQQTEKLVVRDDLLPRLGKMDNLFDNRFLNGIYQSRSAPEQLFHFRD